MRLHSIEIKNLRSVRHSRLEACGDFNVLIGKNNSGKSNVLTAINHLFNFLSAHVLATSTPRLRRDVDFFGSSKDSAIEIVASLEARPTELDAILEALANEFPQVKESLPVPGSVRFLQVHVVSKLTPEPLEYLHSVTIAPTLDFSESSMRPLFTLDFETAQEIAQNQKDLEVRERDASAIRGLSQGIEDDWERWKTRTSLPISMRVRDELSPPRQAELLEIIENSASATEAATAVQNLVLDLRARVDERRRAALTRHVGAYAGPVNTIPAYVDQLVALLGGCKVLHLADRRSPIGADEAARLLQLKMSRGGGPTLQRIQNTVNSLLGVEIDAFASENAAELPPSRRTTRTGLPAAELDVDNYLVQMNGSGIREALRVVLDLEFESAEIVLVEEPEVHLHPALEIAMMRHLKSVSPHTQVFLTTHSTNFLDTGDMKNVYMVSNTMTGTEVQHLDIEAAESEIPKELGIRLSSVFMFDRLVFVEGVSDELVLRTFAEKLGINLSSANVGFVTMGGARNFTHYAAQSTLEILGRRQVHSHFVIDRDERTEAQIDQMTERLVDQAKLHVLKRREIENYLREPQAIVDFIELRRQKAGLPRIDDLTASRVADILIEKAEQLKDESVAKRVAAAVCRIHRADREKLLHDYPGIGIEAAARREIEHLSEMIAELSANLEADVERAREEVESHWFSNKLDVVAGHELLDETVKEFGVRYKKERDAGNLVELVPAASIPEELSKLLRQISEN